MTNIFSTIIDFVLNLVETLGYLGIAFGTFAESIFPPIPSEVVLGLAGLLVFRGELSFVPVVISAIIGNAISVSIIWYMGYKYGKSIILKFGKYVGVTENDLDKGEKIFQKYGYASVFLSQVIPTARTLVAIPAGVLKTNYLKFIVANSCGAAIWFTFLTWLGTVFGENYEEIENLIAPFGKVVVAIIVIAFIYIVYKIYKNVQKINKENSNT